MLRLRQNYLSLIKGMCTLFLELHFIHLFFSLEKRIPLFYIILLVFTSLFVITDLTLAHYVYKIKLDYNYLFLLFRTVFYTYIWIPYFIILRLKEHLYPSSFKLPLCWLHSLTPVT
ncbi:MULTISPECIES: DUF2569 family protein [unclassified Photorhabdus]|uniref:DUF2569 family protein n=1 Tax=unclassified Photorhabdus TaxID=2620880 RepID=UPI000DCB0072|nr:MULTISPECIES: DUF2569 family protein [unclassified Photorhabdus]RAW96309.1 hypothetical protein CKY05_16065 [Photorhabdus sp. S10-54]RAW96370.1 hypothetical protein CKY03_15700 [Photorhabdus sp. S9-53]RAX00621.1 hypothetical protein CKY04_16005 [Photorhabdus sp. S8-52]